MKKAIILIFALIVSSILQPEYIFAQGKELTPEEFVAMNLKKTRERLETLKKKYGQEIKDFTLTPKTLLAALPKAHTLKFIIETKTEERKRDELGYKPQQVFPRSIFLTLMKNVSKGVAADDLTSSVLRIGRNIDLSIREGGFATKMVDGCCDKWRIVDIAGSVDARCISYAKQSQLVSYSINPVGVFDNFRLEVSEGGEVLNKERVRFNRPGRAVVRAILPHHYYEDNLTPETEYLCTKIVKSPTPKPGTKDVFHWEEKDNVATVITKWNGKSRGQTKSELELEVVSFEGIEVDGREYRRTDNTASDIDIFSFEEVCLADNYREPNAIIRRATRTGDRLSDGVITTREPVLRWDIPIRYTISDEGPFIVTRSGCIRALSTGEGRLRMDIGTSWYLNRTITANRLTYDMDREVKDGVVSPGVLYRVAINIQGPAKNMQDYNIKWSGNGIEWQAPDKSFVRKGEGWIGENHFKLTDRVKQEDRLALIVEVENIKNGQKILKIFQPLKTFPHIASIGLELAGKGQPPTSEVIDLFFPNHLPDGNRFMPYFIYRDKDGRDVDPAILRPFYTLMKLTLHSNAPEVAQVFSGGGQIGTIVGESMISAQLELYDKKFTSKWVKVTANKLLLTRGGAEGGTSYIIRVIGPADMGKYTALFYHGGGIHRASFIKGNDGSQSASISTRDKIERVEIMKEGKAIAMLPVNENIVLPEPGIKLLPIKLPGQVIDTITPVDMGSLTSTSACRDMLRKQFPQYYGTAPDDVLNPICQGMREKEKADLKEQRAVEKAQLEILKALKKEGRRLIVFSDATEIAAAVSGSFDPKRMYCRWRIDKGGSLKLERAQTDIVRVGFDGACFNKITGFQGNFDTDAQVTVELVYAYPPVPLGQFIPGSEAPSSMIVDRKSIDEWVNR